MSEKIKLELVSFEKTLAGEINGKKFRLYFSLSDDKCYDEVFDDGEEGPSPLSEEEEDEVIRYLRASRYMW